jgi:hypothetical protein
MLVLLRHAAMLGAQENAPAFPACRPSMAGKKQAANEWRLQKEKCGSEEPHFDSNLLLLGLLEHAIQSLVGRVAAGLSRLRRLQSLVRGALSTRSSLLCLRSCALRAIRRILRSFSSRTNRREIFLGNGCTAGHDRKAADERRCTQSSLDFCGH